MIITSLSLLLDYCFMYYLREADFRYHCVAKRERYRKKNTTKTTAPRGGGGGGGGGVT